MAQASPLPPTASSPEQQRKQQTQDIIHKAALAGAVVCPLVMLLPPRRFDLRNTFLAGVFFLSTNQIAYEYTGTSVWQRFANRAGQLTGGSVGLPEKAQRTSELIREAREREAALKNQSQRQAEWDRDRARGISETAKQVWLGGETEDWGKKRTEEHRQALEEGKGISDIMIDQISDVLSGNWSGKKGSDQGDASARDSEVKEAAKTRNP